MYVCMYVFIYLLYYIHPGRPVQISDVDVDLIFIERETHDCYRRRVTSGFDPLPLPSLDSRRRYVALPAVNHPATQNKTAIDRI